MSIVFSKLSKEVEETIQYLATGGLGEVLLLAEPAAPNGKVQGDYVTIMALCVLASEALNARSTNNTPRNKMN